MIELLIVLAITSLLLVGAGTFGFRARQTVSAQQYIKTIILQTRSARRKSMLITRSSQDSSWVFGIGVQLKKQGGGWQLTQTKALEKSNKSYFYQAYPKNIEDMDFVTLDTSATQTLPAGINIKLLIPKVQGSLDKTCMANMTELRIIFESINGRLHTYCYSPDIGAYIQLGDNSASATATVSPDLSLSLNYDTGGSFRYKVNLGSNGNISTSTF